MAFQYEYLLLIPIGFIAGFLNTIAGGGTLLTLPALIFLGLPAPLANGTNRIAILIQTFTAVKGFKSKGISTYPFSLYLGISAFLGSFIGAKIAIGIDGALFNRILSIIMIMVLLTLLFGPKKNYADIVEKTTGKPLYIAIGIFFFLGIYGGFINAGIGFLMLIILPYLNGLSLLKSNVTKVFVVWIYTIGAVIVFALEDKINYPLAFILTIGNASGAWFGSRWSVKKDDKVIKLFLIITVSSLAIKLWFF
ncbi:integrase [Flavobacterium sp. 316]|uniref:Probable membrane transporter protein n=1 Tax=Flavobacterium sediminilitoris TaxID=2024526 RepID=A0ABY4HL98_9FLAO|nr:MULTISPECIES: sulfite exporter TauE/SafE family protein [Flavobacterium]KIX22433.1 integrase [Flavobacterium sp. 316]UOX33629.1 sulfite exporter TauE/SafE family protein [Flavobacterium sediminilitoris]